MITQNAPGMSPGAFPCRPRRFVTICDRDGACSHLIPCRHPIDRISIPANGLSHAAVGVMQRVNARGAFSLRLVHLEESGSIPDPPNHRGGIALTLREKSATMPNGALSGVCLTRRRPLADMPLSCTGDPVHLATRRQRPSRALPEPVRSRGGPSARPTRGSGHHGPVAIARYGPVEARSGREWENVRGAGGRRS